MLVKDLGTAGYNRQGFRRKAHQPPVTPVTDSDIVDQNTRHTGGKGPQEVEVFVFMEGREERSAVSSGS
jgi:hypothetical protein